MQGSQNSGPNKKPKHHEEKEQSRRAQNSGPCLFNGGEKSLYYRCWDDWIPHAEDFSRMPPYTTHKTINSKEITDSNRAKTVKLSEENKQ